MAIITKGIKSVDTEFFTQLFTAVDGIVALALAVWIIRLQNERDQASQSQYNQLVVQIMKLLQEQHRETIKLLPGMSGGGTLSNHVHDSDAHEPSA